MAWSIAGTVRPRRSSTGFEHCSLQWAASHLVFALLGPTIAMAASGLTAGLVHGANTGDIGRELPRVLAGALVQLPAIWLLTAGCSSW